MHAKSGLRVVLKWKIYRPDSVIADVIRLKVESTGYRIGDSNCVRPKRHWSIESTKIARLQQNDEKRTSSCLMVQTCLGSISIVLLLHFKVSAEAPSPRFKARTSLHARQESRLLRERTRRAVLPHLSIVNPNICSRSLTCLNTPEKSDSMLWTPVWIEA